MIASTAPRDPGLLLRQWRRRRSLSQLSLAAEAEISQRHLSFIESGRSVPSRDMVLRLAEQLSIPLRERNTLLVAAGHAPVFPERAPDDPELQAARRAVELILKRHEPFPALAIDRHWTMVEANAPVHALLDGVADFLLRPPVNVLRVSLHPDGLAPRVRNYREWRDHVFVRLGQQIDLTADTGLMALRDELAAFPTPSGADTGRASKHHPPGGIAVPLRLSSPAGELAFISTTTIFGTAVDITLSELAIESFFPADDETAERLGAVLASAT